MKKVAVLFCLLALLLVGCDKVEKGFFRSYINTYYSYNDLLLSITDSGNIQISGADFQKHYSWKSKGRDKEIYDSLCVIHDDMTYNRLRDYIDAPEWGHCTMFDIKSITVFSNSDFDESHPAGVSLNDIIRFISATPKKFIDSGYTLYYDWLNNTPASFKHESEMENFKNNPECSSYFPIDKKLSEIDEKEMTLLFPQHLGYLIFESEPTVNKLHTLMITITLSNGKTITHLITKEFN
jgi:hypothetical protein